ncbi:Sugar carrier protein C [Hibiscus syriacus]|uniref:Sugar carrier protein C n=1 Tax=Hibiscus syriacus TaxID=106335 RepID=A0A6A3C3Z5_HIBSY|nr:Sugar carrier protein C [Hibiscus syriacus]
MPAVGGIGPGTGKDYPGNLTRFVTVTCIVADMGSEVTTMTSFLQKFFRSVWEKKEADKSKNKFCQYDSQTLTMFTSSLYLAALLSSIVASIVSLSPDLVAAIETSKLVEHPWRNLLQRKYSHRHLTMAILIPFFQQLTGINVIMFYAPVLFSTIGFKDDTAFMSAMITGVFNVGATVVLIYGVDKWGRRFLFLEGGVQMLICQGIVAACIGAKFGISGNPGELPKWYAIVVVLFICIYVAGFAWSWGPLGVHALPLEIRALPVLRFFRAGNAHIRVLLLALPETKGIPMEETNPVWKSQWYWSRFVEDLDCPNGGQGVKEVLLPMDLIVSSLLLKM